MLHPASLPQYSLVWAVIHGLSFMGCHSWAVIHGLSFMVSHSVDLYSNRCGVQTVSFAAVSVYPREL